MNLPEWSSSADCLIGLTCCWRADERSILELAPMLGSQSASQAGMAALVWSGPLESILWIP